MTDSSEDRDPVEALAEEFVNRHRRGEKPSLQEYQDKYPDFADDIRDLFPALVKMERVRPQTGDATGDYGAEASLVEGKKLERVGDYRILREVGRGGMGIVYEAEQESLGRHVALKVLPAHTLLDPQRLRRFQREAKAAARLHHTNIVPVFGVGEDEGLHYYVMQFIQGQGLDEVLVELRKLRQAKSTARSQILAARRQDSNSRVQNASEVAKGLLTGQFVASPTEASTPSPCLPAPVGPASRAGLNVPIASRHLPGEGKSGESVPAPKSLDASRSSLSDSVIHLPGQPLHTTLSDSGREYWQSVARIGIQVAEALTYAHNQGTLHRDIKPSNLLLDTQGAVWITDFGLAKAVESDDLTRTGDIVGTIRYMAPERFQGKSDGRSDVYGLGVTLYELLTLRPAFDESDRARLVQRVTQLDPPAPRRLDRRMPRDLETIVLKAIAKEPDKRYQTAAELGADLQRFVADRPIQARRSSSLEITWRWCRRNPALATLTASVIGLLLIIATGSSIASWWLKIQWESAQLDKRDAITSLNRATRAEEEKTKELFEAKLARAQAGRLSRRMGQRFESLKALTEAAQIAREMHLPADEFLKLRNEAIACLALPDVHPGQTWEIWLPGTTYLVFNADYRTYARADDQGTISVRRLPEDQELCRLPSLARPIENMLFSPNGRFLAVYAPSGVVEIWNLDRGRSVFSNTSIGHGWDFSPDSQRFAVALSDGSVSIYDLASAKETRRFHPAVVSGFLAFHPGGHQLAVGQWQSPLVQIWDVDSGTLVTELRFEGVSVHSAAWHPAGNRLGIGLGDGRTEIWDTNARRRVASMEGHTNAVGAVFHPSGDLLVTQSWDGTARAWDTGTGRQLLSWPNLIANQRFSRDGRILGYMRDGSRVQFVEFAGGREYRSLVSSLGAGQGEYHAVDISPDGRLLAVGMGDGFRLLELASGRELAYVRQSRTRTVLFGPKQPELLTCEDSGCLRRWPLESDPQDPGRLRLGLPHLIPLPFPPHRISRSRDGRLLACATLGNGNAMVLDLPRETVLTTLGPHDALDSALISPDGQWVATCGWHSPLAMVWNAHTGELVKELSLGKGPGMAFTPDSKTLVTCRAEEYSFWEIGSWQVRRQVRREMFPYAGPIAFSPDERLLAVETAPGVIELLNATTANSLAKLEDPHQDRTTQLMFSPDGTKLVAIAPNSRVVHVWELRAIREELDKMGLDWDQPPYPPTEPTSPTKPLTVKVDTGDFLVNPGTQPDRARETLALWSMSIALSPYHPEPYHQRGHIFELLGRPEQAIDDFTAALFWQSKDAKRQAHLLSARGQNHWRLKQFDPGLADMQKAVDLDPDNAELCNALAWYSVTAPENLRDPDKALPLAKKAVDNAPEKWTFRNTLGVVYYRLGQYEAAVIALERSQREGLGAAAAFDLFFLAMSYARLGDSSQAKNCHDQAIKWVQEHQSDLMPGWQEELTQFRAEAESVMALKGKASNP